MEKSNIADYFLPLSSNENKSSNKRENINEAKECSKSPQQKCNIEELCSDSNVDTSLKKDKAKQQSGSRKKIGGEEELCSFSVAASKQAGTKAPVKKKVEDLKVESSEEKSFPIPYHKFLEYTNVLDVVDAQIKISRRHTYEQFANNIDYVQKVARRCYLYFYMQPKSRKKVPLKDLTVSEDCPEELKMHFMDIPEKFRRIKTKKKKTSKDTAIEIQEPSTSQRKVEDSFNDSEDLIEILTQSECGSSQKKRERKIKEKWTSQQTEQLIEEVKMREGLWNFLAKDNRDRNLREAMWQEIASEMQMSRAEVSSKWNSIRCSFRVSLNKSISTKSGQAAGKDFAMSSLHKSLLFLEPTLRFEAPTISTLTKKLDPPSGQEDVEDSMPLTLAASSKRSRRDHNKADEYSNAVECALKTLNTVSKIDIWDDVGNFVSSNGREWETTNTKLANDFKTSIYKTVFEFQVKASNAVHL